MCTKPLKLTIHRNGTYEEITTKCGKCDTCRYERAQEWAIKLINEAKYHKKGCFITLTFDNKILLDKESKAYKYGARVGFAYDINKSKDYFTKFIKRLRKAYTGTPISYYHIGEYGEKTHRPHHHAIIYGINFTENGMNRPEMRVSKSGKVQYYSQLLEDLWACGMTSIQDLNPRNIMYISQYCLKKYKSKEMEKKYKSVMTFSNRCKISVKWVRRNFKEIVKGYLTDSDGKKYRVPKSYLNNLSKDSDPRMKEAARKHEEKIQEKISEKTDDERLTNQKRREEARRQRAKQFNKYRDF